MKEYGGVDMSIHIFLTSALVGGEWSASRPCRFTPWERSHCIHWIGVWVGPRADLDYVEKRKFLTLPGLEVRPLDRPACSQSQYLLSSRTYTYKYYEDLLYTCMYLCMLYAHTFLKESVRTSSVCLWLYSPLN
jgi:hypothetical protein